MCSNHTIPTVLEGEVDEPLGCGPSESGFEVRRAPRQSCEGRHSRRAVDPVPLDMQVRLLPLARVASPTSSRLPSNGWALLAQLQG